VVPPGSGAADSGTWHPTVLWLFAFVIVEMVVVKCLEKVLR